MGALIIKKKQKQRALRDTRKTIEERRIEDAKRRARDTDIEDEDNALENLTEEEITALKELIPFKEALIKIAKGEFEIERIIEEDDEDDTEEDTEEELEEVTGDDEDDNIEVDGDLDNEEEFTEDLGDTEVGNLEDSEAVNEAWRKRLNGTK